MSEITGPRRRFTRRARWLAGLTGGLVIAGGGVAVGGQVWDGGGASVGESVGCYAAAALEADMTVINSTDRAPVDACAELWRRGEVKQDVTKTPPGLVACLLKTGPVGVFPGGGGTCERLGLRPARAATPAERDQAIAVRKLRDDLLERLNARCIPKDEAVRLIEGRIQAHGLTGWGVRVPPDFDRHGRCTSFGLDEPQKKVFIIGMASVG